MRDAGLEAQVSRHYGRGDLVSTIYTALERNGVDLNTLSIDDLAPADEFHTAGRATTLQALALMSLQPRMRVLDAGCGIGGTARRIARDHQCQVEGIDLTPEFIEAAKALTEKVGLSQACTFTAGSVLAMPYADASFDAAVTFHVAMNIEDRAGFYRELARVIKPGGALCLFDVMKGPSAGMIYPVPWAETEATSFLRSTAETRALLKAAGFEVTREANLRAFALDFFRDAAAKAGSGAPPPVGINLLIGDGAQTKIGNYLAAVEAHQIEPVIHLARRA